MQSLLCFLHLSIVNGVIMENCRMSMHARCIYDFYLFLVSPSHFFLWKAIFTYPPYILVICFGRLWSSLQLVKLFYDLTHNRHILVDCVLAYQTSGHGSKPSSDMSNKTKYEKLFLRHLPFSRFLAITLRVNKIAMKSFSKIHRLESTFRFRYSWIK